MSIRLNFFKLLLHDFRIGILKRWKVYCVSAVLFLSAGAIMTGSAGRLTASGLLVEKPTFLDMAAYSLQGMEIYTPGSHMPFQVPVLWLCIHLYLAFCVGNYPLHDLTGYGQQMLLRSKKRSQWWLSKCCWCGMSVLFYYGIGYAALFILSLFTGRPECSLTLSVSQAISGFTPLAASGFREIAGVLLIPPLISYALSLFQTFVSFLLKPIYSYFLVAALLIVSAFFFTPLLLGNYLMILRSALAVANGIPCWLSALVGVGVLLVCTVSGSIYFKKYDILEKN